MTELAISSHATRREIALLGLRGHPGNQITSRVTRMVRCSRLEAAPVHVLADKPDLTKLTGNGWTRSDRKKAFYWLVAPERKVDAEHKLGMPPPLART